MDISFYSNEGTFFFHRGEHVLSREGKWTRFPFEWLKDGSWYPLFIQREGVELFPNVHVQSEKRITETHIKAGIRDALGCRLLLFVFRLHF